MMTLEPPPCADATAYVTLWSGSKPQRSGHLSSGLAPKSTYMRTMYASDTTSLPEHRILRQVQLILVLLRSLRRVERRYCREFIVLLGTEVHVPLFERSVLESEGVRFHTVPPLLPGVPTADKLWIWSALRNYTQCLVLDSDVMVLKPIDDLFGRAEELTIAHHPYDHLQAQCGIPLERRGVAAMFVMRPNAAIFDEYLTYVYDSDSKLKISSCMQIRQG